MLNVIDAWRMRARRIKKPEREPIGKVSLSEFASRIDEAEEYSPLARLILALAPLWFFLFLAGIAVLLAVLGSWLNGGGLK